MKAVQDISFEEALERLNKVVRELEEGDLPVEKALSLFAEGIELVKRCREILSQAEQRITVLTAELGDLVPEETGYYPAGGEKKR